MLLQVISWIDMDVQEGKAIRVTSANGSNSNSLKNGILYANDKANLSL
jgi:hypothetical protein